jgi:hypothetical protein
MASANDSGTTLGLVRRTLVQQIRNITVGQGDNGQDVEVIQGMSAIARSADDVQIGDAREWEQTIQQSRSAEGKHKRNESFLQDVNIYVVRQDADEANDQAILIWDLIDDFISSSTDLGLELPTLTVGQQRFGNLNTTYDESRLGWRAHLRMQIMVTAKLSA